MELKEQLKELSFQMMLIETRKMQMENERSFEKKENFKYPTYQSEEYYCRSLMRVDKEGYELSLQFNELLLQNGKNHNAFVDGPDATKIYAENLLYKYNLHYPLSWYVEYEDKDGLHFGYHYSDTINKNHEVYLAQVEKLYNEGKINRYIKERLVLAGEYYCNHRKLLSKYHNGEVLEESKVPSRH